MALIFDATGKSLSRTANVPGSNLYTICGWARQISSTGVYGTIAAISTTGPNAASYHEFAIGATNLLTLDTNSSANNSFPSSPAVGDPFFWAIKSPAAGGGNFQGRWRGFNSQVFISDASTANTFTATTVTVGQNTFGEFANVVVWNVKAWNRALTDAELLVESYFQRVMYPLSINFHWPLVSDAVDISGNARNGTAAGSPAFGSHGNFGILMPKKQIFIPPLAANTPDDVIGSTTLTFAQSARLGGYRNARGTAALTFSQTGVLTGAALDITDVDVDERINSNQTGWDITGMGFDTATVELRQGVVTVVQDVNSQSATSIDVDTIFDNSAASPTLHLKYGAATLAVVNGDDSEDTIAIIIDPPAGKDYVDLTSVETEADNRLTAFPDLAVGDQIEWSNVVGGTVADVEVNADGTFDCDSGVLSFDVRVWSGGAWGPIATQSVGESLIGSADITFNEVANLVGYGNLRATASLSFASTAVATPYANARASAALSFNNAVRATAYGNMQGSASLSFAGSAVAKAYSNARASAALTFNQVGRASIYVNVRATASFTFAGTGDVGSANDGHMIGTVSLSFGALARLSAYDNLRGAALLSFASAARPSAYSSMRGSSSLTFGVTGGTSAIRDMLGSTTLSFTTQARANALRNMRGASSLTFLPSASIAAYVNCIASVELSFEVEGSLTAYLSLSGSSSIVFSTTGKLASPFVPGVIIFGVPVEVAQFRIQAERNQVKI